MPKFEFNLQAVLTVREHAEKERQRALGVLLAQMKSLEDELTALDQANKSSAEDLRDSRLIGPIDLAFLAGHRRYVLANERKARTVLQKMALLQREIEQARALLVEAARDRKVVEKLRERKLDAWRQNLARMEQQEIDEVGSKLTVLEWQQEARTPADVQ